MCKSAPKPEFGSERGICVFGQSGTRRNDRFFTRGNDRFFIRRNDRFFTRGNDKMGWFWNSLRRRIEIPTYTLSLPLFY